MVTHKRMKQIKSDSVLSSKKQLLCVTKNEILVLATETRTDMMAEILKRSSY
jgi:hypothetical protein